MDFVIRTWAPRGLQARAMSGKHHHHRHDRFGGPEGPPFFAWGGGPGGPSRGRGRRGRGPRARRGDVRTALLLLLAEEPRNGYGLMREIEARSEGTWRASPGSVYPALQQLEDEGLVTQSEADGRKVFALTDDGRKVVADRPEDAVAPWESVSRDFGDEAFPLADAGRQLGFAVLQVMDAGSPAQVEEARKVLNDARKALYGILAQDEPPAPRPE